MLIKCSECGAQISDMATQCPQCGYPIAKIHRVAEAKKAVLLAKQTVVDRAPGFVKGAKFLGIIAAKVVLLLIVLSVLTLLYRFVNEVADYARDPGKIYYRPFMNFIMPFFWAPIFIVVKKLFGRRVVAVVFWIFIAIMPISIFVHVGHLIEGSRYADLSSAEFTIALSAKLVGLLVVAGIGYDEKRENQKDEE